MTGYPGRCAECSRRRPEVFAAVRMGGGSYRRPPRQYASSICLPCAIGALARHTPGHYAGAMHWQPYSLQRVVDQAGGSE